MITTEIKKIGRVIPIRLGPDEDLMEGMLAACRKYEAKDVIVLSAIGSLKHVNVLNAVPVEVRGEEIVYGYDDAPRTWGDRQGVLEMCSVKGLIHLADDGSADADLHLTASNAAGVVIGGKLVAGTLVKLTCEIVLGVLE